MVLVPVLVPTAMVKAMTKATIRVMTRDTTKECLAAKAFRWAPHLFGPEAAHRHSLLPFLVKMQTTFPLTRLRFGLG